MIIAPKVGLLIQTFPTVTHNITKSLHYSRWPLPVPSQSKELTNTQSKHRTGRGTGNEYSTIKQQTIFTKSSENTLFRTMPLILMISHCTSSSSIFIAWEQRKRH